MHTCIFTYTYILLPPTLVDQQIHITIQHDKYSHTYWPDICVTECVFIHNLDIPFPLSDTTDLAVTVH